MAADAFDAAYDTGINAPLSDAEFRSASAHALGGPKAPPPSPLALAGTVITPERALTRGWVVVADGHIADIHERRPDDLPIIDTGGIILPGLIDLHGHPEYNIFAPWEPPKTYINRAQWRGSTEYDALIKQPWHRLTDSGTSTSVKTAMARYAETRALVGGVTAIQGASKHYPKPIEALVRNVDLVIFGQQIARSTVDFDRLTPDDIAHIKADIAAGTVKAHYVHLAEGQPSNTASVREFTDFANSGLLGPATVMIHGTALQRADFDQLHAAGGKLVWSPQSNLRLYNHTTDIGAAADAGVPIALGADWTPTGSPSLLHELKIAQRVLTEDAVPLNARDLVHMVTSQAATIAGLDTHLGSIKRERPADLTVLQRQLDDPYDNIVAAYPSWVELVMIGGDIAYSRPDWVPTPNAARYEIAQAWGRDMRLDTRYGLPRAAPASPGAPPQPPVTLTDIRATLIARYAAVAPIFA